MTVVPCTRSRSQPLLHCKIAMTLSFLIWLSLALLCKAEIPCDSDFYCQEIFERETSLCVDGKCSNPFQQGCLKTAGLMDDSALRICNSDDESTNNDTCIASPYQALQYPEIRIHHGNWETSIFQAWIYQIIFMEFLQVPATVGLSTSDTKAASFYSPQNTIEFSTETYPYQAIRESNRVQDCKKTEDPCVHVLPEVSEHQQQEFDSLMSDGSIIIPAANGQVALGSLYVPAYTARKFPSVAVHYGLKGESRRKFLAESFGRPTTWLEYCEEVSKNRCSEPDGTTKRPPESEDEMKLYFSEGQYTGHFQFNNSTGYIAGFPCSWTGNLEGQLFWNDIVGLKMDGPEPPGGQYNYPALNQIWRAANATKSHLVMQWYEPDRLVEEFRGTDYEFQAVSFPAATQECARSRPDAATRCNSDFSVVQRRGPEIAKCGYDPSAQVKVVSEYVGSYNFHADEAKQSPAPEIITAIKLKKAEINAIINDWLSIGTDRSGNDAREAVCGWVVDNIDRIRGLIPYGYPKKIIDRSEHNAWYLIMAQIVAMIAGFVTILSMALVYKYRETKIMVFAQPFFVQLVLLGHLWTSMAAFTVASPPNAVSCVAYGWFFIIGYSVELVPVLIKMAAFNRLIKSANKQRRINISKRMMLWKVRGLVLLACVFLTCWTVIDPPTVSTFVKPNRDDGQILDLEEICSSESEVWLIFTFGWQALLLLMCAILAFQSRNVMKEINEAKAVGFAVYSHFVFMLLRGIFMYFDSTGVLYSSVINALFSFNFSLDVLLAIVIYILPKILKARKNPEKFRPNAFTSSRRQSELISEREANGALKILLCTANLGNAAPTMESMEAWIPPGGSCAHVSPLEGVREMGSGNFDLIVVGMQEATWKEKKRQSIRGNKISEAEILTAMEEHHTAAIREMTQDILGEDYSQVGQDCRGQMKLSIWAFGEVVDDIENIKISGANTGIGNVMANKGGIVISLTYQKTRMSFISAHLAAHEGENFYKNRCDDARAILREGKTYELSKKLDVSVSSHHMFFMGDLNFRTKFGNPDWKHEDNFRRAHELVQAEDYETLYSFDELHKGVANGDLLVGFETLPCKFPPTFKVERQAGLVYRDQRTPSYTDRILFKSAGGLESRMKPLAYEPCVDFITSDHKPVRGAFSVVPNSQRGLLPDSRNIRLVFNELECSDLPAGDSDGLSDPYLRFLWDGVDLEPDNMSLQLRRLFRQSWPRTRYISKDLNPKWEGEEITLAATNSEFGSDAMLYIVVMDYDAVSQDDFLCALPLNVNALISLMGRQVTKTIQIDRPLLRDGKHSGRIKFQVHIDMSSPSHRRGALMSWVRSSAVGFLPRSTIKNSSTMREADEISRSSRR